VLFVVLDAYIIARLAGLLQSARDPAWRSVYAWLLLASVMWLGSDVAVALTWQGVLPFVDSGTAWDLAWPLSIVAVVVAARAGAYQPVTSQRQALSHQVCGSFLRYGPIQGHQRQP